MLLFSCPVVSDSWPHGWQHARPPCLSPSARVYPSSWHQWCCPVISTSDALLSFCPQPFPASWTFPMSLCLDQTTKILALQLQLHSFQWMSRADLPEDWLVWSPCCPRDFQEFSPAPQFKGINSLVFCLLYSSAPTTICDQWEDHSLDYTDFRRQSNVSACQHTV